MTAYLVTTVVLNVLLTAMGYKRFLHDEEGPAGVLIAFVISGGLAVWGLVLLLRDVP